MVVIWATDWISGVVLLLTLPIVLLFMVLAGLSAQRRTNDQWNALARMSNHFLDVVEGLTTLRVFGRARAQRTAVQSVTNEYRRTTMTVLRLSFLSLFVLELFASLSVAIVAVQVGLRLIGGSIELESALIVLLLAPEAFQPLRTLGAGYHAAADGRSATQKILDILDQPAPPPGTRAVPKAAKFVTVRDVTVRRADSSFASCAPTSFGLRRSEVVAMAGPSGCGKSTLLSVMLGFLEPSAGTVRMDGVSVAEADRQSWLGHIAWVPQRPTLVAGTVAENVRLGAADAMDTQVAAALAKAACEGLDPRRRIAQNGVDLSAGERQRIALARCFLRTERGADLLLLDEPTAHLDAPTEQRALAAIRRTQCRPLRVDGGAPSLFDRFRRSDGRDRRRHPRGATHDQRGTVMSSPSEVTSGVGSTRRLLALAAPGRKRFFTACGLGVLAVGSGVGLIACAGWLISAASLQPHIAALTVAIVGVRAFALAKAALRYSERLVSHDVAFRMLATIRTRFVAVLEPLSPGALPTYHRGDLLARMVSDVDGLQDLPLRVLHPVAVAAGAAALAVGIVATLLPTSAAVLAATLAVAAVAVPAATSWANRHAESRLAAVRAELSTGVLTLLNARADLVADGAAPQHLAELTALDARLTRIARSSALAAGVGAALAVFCAGGAVWGALALGTSAVRAGAMSGVMLAVVVLIPLAAFEAVAILPTATLAYGRSRQSGERVIEVMDTPVPVIEPSTVRRLDRANLWPISLQCAGARWSSSHPPAPAAITGVDLELTPGRTVAVVGESGSGKTTLSAMLLRFVELSSGHYRIGPVNARNVAGDEVRRVVGLCAQDAHIFDSTIRENLRLARPDCDDDELRDALRRVRLLKWVEASARRLGHPGRGRWSPAVRRRTPADIGRPGVVGRLPRDRVRRTHRQSRPTDRRRAGARPRDGDRRSRDRADNPSTFGSRTRRRDHRAEERRRGRAGQHDQLLRRRPLRTRVAIRAVKSSRREQGKVKGLSAYRTTRPRRKGRRRTRRRRTERSPIVDDRPGAQMLHTIDPSRSPLMPHCRQWRLGFSVSTLRQRE